MIMQQRKWSTSIWFISFYAAAFVFSGCQSSGDRRSYESEKLDIGESLCCKTPDTLMELVGAGWAMMGASNETVNRTLAEAVGSSAAMHSTKKDALFDTSVIQTVLYTVYGEWGITFNPGDSSLGASLPQTVYETKKGTCLGIGLLMLLLAEKSGYPMYGVVLPGHFFVRYDNGTARRNIEPNASGTLRTDGYYRQRYGVSPDSWYYPLRNLSKKEAAAVFFYMLGNDARQKRNLPEARGFYERSITLFPGYPDAQGNLALVLAEQGAIDSALAVLDRAGRINPADRNVLRNKVSLLLRQKRFKAVVERCSEYLSAAPDDTELLDAYALGLIGLKRYAEANSIIGRLRTCGESVRAAELLGLVPSRSGR
jgi:regulator of sirC expression with transglutaminase-like and TPR domain